MRTLALSALWGSTFAGMTSVNSGTASGYLHESDCRLDDFIEIVEQTTDIDDYPFAESIVQNVVGYDCDRLRAECVDPGTRRAVQAELNKAFLEGPGIVVFKRAYPDPTIVDRVTASFKAMIAEQHRLGMKSGDHYAKPGDNDRVWNALEKLAVTAPDEFVDYYANDIIHMASAAWLGPRLHPHVTGQRRQSGRRGPEAAPRLPPRVHDRRRGRGVPGQRTSPVGCAHAAGRDRPLRHAGRERPDDVPAPRTEVPLRLPGVVAPRVPRVLRAALRAVAVAQGRCRVLQSCAVPCRRHQPHHRRVPNGQPLADQLAARQVPRGHRPREDGQCRSTRHC